MNHLSECQYAIVRKSDGVVINVVVASHNPELLWHINEAHEGDTEILSCCEFGFASVGGVWDGQDFRPVQPWPSWNWNSVTKQWEAPTGMPDDENRWAWNEEQLEWQQIPVGE